MTTDGFKKAQLRLGLKNKGMADLLCVTENYVEMLRSEKSSKSASPTLQRIIAQAEEINDFNALPKKVIRTPR